MTRSSRRQWSLTQRIMASSLKSSSTNSCYSCLMGASICSRLNERKNLRQLRMQRVMTHLQLRSSCSLNIRNDGLVMQVESSQEMEFVRCHSFCPIRVKICKIRWLGRKSNSLCIWSQKFERRKQDHYETVEEWMKEFLINNHFFEAPRR